MVAQLQIAVWYQSTLSRTAGKQPVTCVLSVQLAFPAAIFALVVVWTLATYGMFR